MSDSAPPKSPPISFSKSFQKFAFGNKMIINLKDIQLFEDNKEKLFTPEQKE